MTKVQGPVGGETRLGCVIPLPFPVLLVFRFVLKFPIRCCETCFLKLDDVTFGLGNAASLYIFSKLFFINKIVWLYLTCGRKQLQNQ